MVTTTQQTTDTYKPYISFITTEQCNLRCKMCHWSDKAAAKDMLLNQRTMTNELFKRVLAESTNIAQAIGLTMVGEFLSDPLIKERLGILGSFLRNNPRVKFHQLTNASLIDEDLFNYLGSIPNISLAISIDTVDPLLYATIRRPGNLDLVKRNIERFCTLAKQKIEDVEILLNVTLMKRNVFQLRDVIEYASEIGANIHVDHLAKLADNHHVKTESLFHYPELSNRILTECEKYAAQVGVSLNLPPKFKLNVDESTSDTQQSYYCEQIEGRGPVQIAANGDVYPCCQPLVVGNVNNNTLGDILSGELITKIRQSIRLGNPMSPCDTCRHKSRVSPLIYRSEDYGWDIPFEDRFNAKEIDYTKEGFLDWLKELSDVKLRKLVTQDYETRLTKFFARQQNEANATIRQLERARSINKILVEAISMTQRVAVWGLGRDFLWANQYCILADLNVVAYVDGDKDKWGRRIGDKFIAAPESLNKAKFEVLLITSSVHYENIIRDFKNTLNTTTATNIEIVSLTGKRFNLSFY